MNIIKKLIKIFFIIFFSIYKICKYLLSKNKEKLGKEARESYQKYKERFQK